MAGIVGPLNNFEIDVDIYVVSLQLLYPGKMHFQLFQFFDFDEMDIVEITLQQNLPKKKEYTNKSDKTTLLYKCLSKAH